MMHMHSQESWQWFEFIITPLCIWTWSNCRAHSWQGVSKPGMQPVISNREISQQICKVHRLRLRHWRYLKSFYVSHGVYLEQVLGLSYKSFSFQNAQMCFTWVTDGLEFVSLFANTRGAHVGNPQSQVWHLSVVMWNKHRLVNIFK